MSRHDLKLENSTTEGKPKNRNTTSPLILSNLPFRIPYPYHTLRMNLLILLVLKRHV